MGSGIKCGVDPASLTGSSPARRAAGSLAARPGQRMRENSEEYSAAHEEDQPPESRNGQNAVLGIVDDRPHFEH